MQTHDLPSLLVLPFSCAALKTKLSPYKYLHSHGHELSMRTFSLLKCMDTLLTHSRSITNSHSHQPSSAACPVEIFSTELSI